MAAHDTHGHGAAHEEGSHHAVPLPVYYRVFWALMGLLVLTVAAAGVDFTPMGMPWLNVVIAVTIAVVKAVLIMLFFMHLRWSTQLIVIFAVSAFVWLGILFTLTLSDYIARGWLR